MKVGPASAPSSDIGAVIDKPNVARIDKMVEDAIAAGAKGLFYRPALLEVTDSKLPIMQDEVFCPRADGDSFSIPKQKPCNWRTTATMAFRRVYGPEMWIVRSVWQISMPARFGSMIGRCSGVSLKMAPSSTAATDGWTVKPRSTIS